MDRQRAQHRATWDGGPTSSLRSSLHRGCSGPSQQVRGQASPSMTPTAPAGCPRETAIAMVLSAGACSIRRPGGAVLLAAEAGGDETLDIGERAQFLVGCYGHG